MRAARIRPPIARASALSELHSRVSPANIDVARKGLTDLDPMVRISALDMLEDLPGNRIWPLVSPLLTDPSRGVRIRAVSVLADVPATNQPANDREAFERAAAEFIAAQRFNAAGSLPMPRTNIKLHFGSALNLRLRRSIWPIYIGNLAAMATQRRCFGQQLHPQAWTRDCIMLSD